MIEKYSYEIVNSTENSRSMDVLYSCEGYFDMLIGVPKPTETESLADIIELYAPFLLWGESKKKVQEIPTGVKGTVSPEGHSSNFFDKLYPKDRNIRSTPALAFLAVSEIK